MAHWTDAEIPDQSGRTALVTGATGGLGLRVAQALAAHGARVFLGARSPERGAAALESVTAVATDAAPELVSIDLSDQQWVRAAAVDVRDRTGDHLDLLVNNAGIMAPPLGFSPDGIELQWATNVLGPAALTWLLIPAIERVPNARVVFVSSVAHWSGRFTASRLERDARGEGYIPFAYYGRTKLADLLLSRELERYFLRSRASAISVAAHPGYTATGLVGSTLAGQPELVKRIAEGATTILGQKVEDGALPILYAATAPGVRGSQYFGPAWVFETRGPPTRAARAPSSRSDERGAELLSFIERHAGIPRPV